MTKPLKYFFLLLLVLGVAGLGYFISLHLSKPRPLTAEDRILQEMLLQGRAQAQSEHSIQDKAQDISGKNNQGDSQAEVPGELSEQPTPSQSVPQSMPRQPIPKQPLPEQPLPKQPLPEQGPVILKQGVFNPNAEDSDFLHRGRGGVSIVRFMGKNRLVFAEDFHVTNGPDYRIYLLNARNVETEARFRQLKDNAFQLAPLKQFKGYQVFEIPAEFNIHQAQSALIWCEAFGQFISNADFN